MHLLQHATLGIVGDRIDKIILGGDVRRFERRWQEIEDPIAIDDLVRAASGALNAQGLRCR